MTDMVYLDHHATTPVDKSVLAAMLPWLSEDYGNASSAHRMGSRAAIAVHSARVAVAELIGSDDPEEVVFTSGATESNHLAIVGAALAAKRSRGASHVVTTAIEHKSVFSAVSYLTELHGFTCTTLAVDEHGLVSAEDVASAITAETALVSVMYANNEIGTIQSIAELAEVARAAGVVTHTDATQAIGGVPVRVDEMAVDLLSLSAHKIYGPKGVGALFVRAGTEIAAVLGGGGQQGGLRGGTLNVPGIVGLGEACRILIEDRDAEAVWVAGLRDRLQRTLLAAFPDAVVNGHAQRRLPSNLSISVPGLDTDRLIVSLPDVCVATTSACSTGQTSHVLSAIGRDPAWGTLRIGLGRHSTVAEIDLAGRELIAAIRSAGSGGAFPPTAVVG